MVELVGIVAGVVVGGVFCEMGRRALLGARLQRSLARAAGSRPTLRVSSLPDGS